MEQKEINISTSSELELKALIYDQMGVRENANRAITVLKEELDRRIAEKAKAAALEVKKATDAVAALDQKTDAPTQPTGQVDETKKEDTPA